MIQAAINGNRSEACIPSSTEAIIRAAVETVKEGATSIHFHVRDQAGKESLENHWVDEQVAALKKKLPQIPVGISTGDWIEPDVTKRLRQIKSWSCLPDFVSINFDEPGYDEVVKLVSAKGILIEVGLSNVQATLNFVKGGQNSHFLRILLEPQEHTLAAAIKTVESMEEMLSQAKNELPLLLHGLDHTCWRLLQLAFEKGYDSRIGFEDTLVLPNGQPAKNNAELVKEARSIKANIKHS